MLALHSKCNTKIKFFILEIGPGLFWTQCFWFSIVLLFGLRSYLELSYILVYGKYHA